jgi:hypothetical protein
MGRRWGKTTGDTHERAEMMTSLEIHTHRITVASGIVSVQANCTCDEALVLREKYAEVMKQTLDAVAEDVLEHRILFGEGS